MARDNGDRQLGRLEREVGGREGKSLLGTTTNPPEESLPIGTSSRSMP